MGPYCSNQGVVTVFSNKINNIHDFNFSTNIVGYSGFNWVGRGGVVTCRLNSFGLEHGIDGVAGSVAVSGKISHFSTVMKTETVYGFQANFNDACP